MDRILDELVKGETSLTRNVNSAENLEVSEL